MTRRTDVRPSGVFALALLACLIVAAVAAATGPRGHEFAATEAAPAGSRAESALQALATVRKAFPARLAGAFRVFDAPETRLVQKLSDHQAIVADATGRTSLAVGVLPLFGTTGADQSAPLDLTLTARGSGWVPRSALVPMSLPATSVGPVRLIGQPWAVHFASGTAITGSRVNGSVFFANLGGSTRTTDAVLRAIPLGAEISFVLRGASSPVSERLRVTLPAGWRLARSAEAPGALQITSGSGHAAGLLGPAVATDSQGRRIALRYILGKRGQLLINVDRRGGYAYPILVDVPVVRLGLGSWLGSPVAWRALKSSQNPFLTHRAYGEYGAWYGTPGHSYPAPTWGEYSAAAPAGAYIYKATEGDVTHTPNHSDEFGGIARAGGAGWETSGTWRGPYGSGTGAYRAEQRTLSNATYTYCARVSCAPDRTIDAGNLAVFGLRMLGQTAPSMRPAALIDDATVYESDNGPVGLSTPRHSGYIPGTWVRAATDTVSATASEASGLGIYREVVTGVGSKATSGLRPPCNNAAPPPCPLSYTGRMTYSTAGMPAGRHTLSERAVDVGGTVSHTSSWTVNIDRTAPTLTLSGPLANANHQTLSSGRYGLSISARDTNGSTPTSGIARISVLVDGKAQSGVSGFSACSFGAQCGSSGTASWTLDTSHFGPGSHTLDVQALDSAHNVVTSSISFSINAPAPPPQTPAPKMYWGANVGSQFTGGSPPFDWNAETAFAKSDAGGKMPSILSWGQPFFASAYCTSTSPYPAGHYCPFQTSTFDSVRQHGFIPMLSWSSSDAGNYWDSKYTDAAIANGSQNAYITQWARAAKAWGHPLFLRFDWEMNGSWFNYGTGKHSSTQAANSTPAQFVAMWRHVHDIFASVGATNVTWLWCSNVEYPLGSTPASNYPGGAYVDWTCIDAYNGDDPWQSFDGLLGTTYPDVAGLAANKPMMIGETASTATGGSKAQWISGMFSGLAGTFPKVRGFVWEDVDANGSWRSNRLARRGIQSRRIRTRHRSPPSPRASGTRATRATRTRSSTPARLPRPERVLSTSPPRACLRALGRADRRRRRIPPKRTSK